MNDQYLAKWSLYSGKEVKGFNVCQDCTYTDLHFIGKIPLWNLRMLNPVLTSRRASAARRKIPFPSRSQRICWNSEDGVQHRDQTDGALWLSFLDLANLQVEYGTSKVGILQRNCIWEFCNGIVYGNFVSGFSIGGLSVRMHRGWFLQWDFTFSFHQPSNVQGFYKMTFCICGVNPYVKSPYVKTKKTSFPYHHNNKLFICVAN